MQHEKQRQLSAIQKWKQWRKNYLFETDAWKIFHKHVIKMLFTGFQFLENLIIVIEQKVLETLTMWNNKKMVVGGGIKESELIFSFFMESNQ